MANRCQVTGRVPRSGKNVTFSHKRNNRWFKPNIQTKYYWLGSENRWIYSKDALFRKHSFCNSS